jgi:hypothetical protein
MGIISDAIESLDGAIHDSKTQSDLVSNLKNLFLVPEDQPDYPGLPDRETLAGMSRDAIGNLRNIKGLTQADQNYLAPYEHRAAARESWENGIINGVGYAAGSAIYTPVKVANRALSTVGINLPYGGSRSDPSIREIGQGIAGSLEGLSK